METTKNKKGSSISVEAFYNDNPTSSLLGQIIDCEVRGVTVKFSLGLKEDEYGWLSKEHYLALLSTGLSEEYLSEYKEHYTGDDWDDVPYEHNAGSVYNEYIKGTRINYYPFDAILLEPSYGYSNSPYSKQDFVDRKVPCLIYIKDSDYYNTYFERTYEEWAKDTSEYVEKYYFGDVITSGKYLYTDIDTGVLL